MYTIISKIELEGTDNLTYSDYGTTTDQEIELGIVSVSTFFESTPFVYEARTEVDNIEGLTLLNVTNLNQL